MENKIPQRCAPHPGFCEFVSHKKTDSSLLPVNCASNSTQSLTSPETKSAASPAILRTPERKSGSTDEKSHPSDVAQGFTTPELPPRGRPATPGTPRFLTPPPVERDAEKMRHINKKFRKLQQILNPEKTTQPDTPPAKKPR